MPITEIIRLALTGLRASPFSFASNVLATTVGLTFLGTLLAMMTGVGHSLERYYTRTVSLTTLTVYQPEDHVGMRPFDRDYRQELLHTQGVQKVIYHELGFVQIGVTQGKMRTVCLRSAIQQDPEIERLERLAGTNLPQATDPLRPAIVIPLIVAQRLSDLPLKELIGMEVAIVADRSLTLEEENEQATLYGTIVGIVNESPENTVYVDFSTSALISTWKRERATPVVEKADATKDGTVKDKRSALETSRDSTDSTGKPATTSTATDPTVATTDEKSPAKFAYKTLQETWDLLREKIQKDSLIYPNLRLHFNNLDTVTAFRKTFRAAGLPTESMLDDIATIRDLRQYGWMIGSVIGLIALIAAACSIFNTLLASVERRTAEVGILRVLGASTREILTMFLLEGLFVAITGALLSSLLLTSGAKFANQWLLQRLAENPEFEHLAALNPELLYCDLKLIGLVLVTGGLVALTASFLPALVACRIQPASALRHR